MNKCLWSVLLACLLLPVCRAGAQISIEVRMEQEYFLRGEAIPIAVRVTNRSGQSLELGQDPDWLTISVETLDGVVLPKLQDPPVVGQFTLETSKVATKRLNIASCFQFETLGRFRVSATVRVKQWNIERTSAPVTFGIIEGARIWQQEFGVPAAANTNHELPEVRRYILQQANYIRGELRLYLRVTDASGSKVYRVMPIGRVLSFSRPEAQIDSASNLHVLYQNGPQTFSYTKYNPDGDLLVRHTFDYEGSRPVLKIDPLTSEIGVKGGARHVLPTDFPPAKTSEEPAHSTITQNTTNTPAESNKDAEK